MKLVQAHDSIFNEIAPGLRAIIRVMGLLPKLESLPLGLARRIFNAAFWCTNPPPDQTLVTKIFHLNDDNLITIRFWAKPPYREPRPAMLFLHGGGWTFGSSLTHRAYCELIASQSNCAVFSLDYRKAPEFPFPHALADVERAWFWLKQKREDWGWQAFPTVIAGDSAGGNLATVFCRRLRDSKQRLPAAQLLLYPVTNFAQDSPSYTKYAEGLLLTRALMTKFFRHYGDAQAATDQDQSPLLAQDLSGLPRTYIGLAGCDILLDEGRAYAHRLKAAGVLVDLEVFPTMIHGFINLLNLPEAKSAALATIAFLQDFFRHHSAKIEVQNAQSAHNHNLSPMETHW